jgi:hypothetical protein
MTYQVGKRIITLRTFPATSERTGGWYAGSAEYYKTFNTYWIPTAFTLSAPAATVIAAIERLNPDAWVRFQHTA